MKKHISVFLCSLFAMSLMLTACGGDHTHTFSSSWASDANNHWHAATCEHGEVKDSLAAHVDANEDGVCDVCEYEVGHEHTYASEWSFDGSYHWKAATCSHTTEKGYYAAHTDANTDGECDDCGGHVHTANAAGYCTGCGELINTIDESDLATVVAAIVAQSGKVNAGTIESTTSMAYSQYYTSTEESSVEYKFGNGCSYKKVVGYDTVELFTYTLENGTLEALEKTTEDGNVSYQKVDANENDLLGYYFSVSTMANAYGAENIVAAIFELANAETASNVMANHNKETNTVTASFDTTIVNRDVAEGEPWHVDYFQTTASFTYSDAYVLTAASISCVVYNMNDDDFTYNQETGVLTMAEDALADTYTFVVAQTAGDRTYVCEETCALRTPTDFTFSYETEDGTITLADNDTLNLVSGKAFALNLACLPETSHVSLAGFDYGAFKVTNNATDPVLSDDDDTNDEQTTTAWNGSAWLQGTEINLICKRAGNYTFTGTLNGETIITVNVVVTDATIDVSDYDSSFTAKVTDTDSFIDAYTFTHTAMFPAVYTFYVPAGFGVTTTDRYAAYEEPLVDYYANTEGTEFVLSLDRGESVEFLFASAYTIREFPIGYNMAQTINVNGFNTVAGSDATFIHIADEDGTLKVITSAADGGDVAFSYYLNSDPEVKTIALSSEVDIPMYAGDILYVCATATGYSSIDSIWTKDTVTSYTGEDDWSNTIDIIINESKKVVTFGYYRYGPYGPQSTASYSYTIEEGVMTLYGADGEPVNALQAAVTLTDGVPTAAVYNGTTYTIASAGGSSTVTETPLTIGTTPINAADATYAYTATEAGTLVLTTGTPIQGAVEISYAVNGGTVTTLAASTTTNIAMAANDKIVITVVAAGYSSITAAWANGSDSNPYVWATLSADPISVDVAMMEKNYYSYKATANGTITFSWETSNNSYGDVYTWDTTNNVWVLAVESISATQNPYTLTVTAGTTYRFGLAGFNSADTVTVSFTAAA